MIEKRVVQKRADDASHANLDGIIEKLSDVETVLVRQIGDHAADLLAAEGITSASIRCSVEQAAKRYAKRGKLLPSPVSGDRGRGDGYSPKKEDCPVRAMKKNIIWLDV